MKAMILATAALLVTFNVHAFGSEKQTSFSKVVCVDVQRNASKTSENMAAAIQSAAIMATVVSVSAPAGVSASITNDMGSYSATLPAQTFAHLCVTVNLQTNK